ncbi:MAG TPA: alkaline phosphatase family protein, partial [Actinomycetota bacterium]|nr:alkaline phosphatase family protein [Actinomycetota bacterium]
MDRLHRAAAATAGILLVAALDACTSHRTAATRSASPTATAAGPTPTETASPTPTASASPSTVEPTASVGSVAPVGRAALDHIAVLVMENHTYGQVIGSADAPSTNSLAHTYALATNYFAVAHPSLPNYLALVGGSTFGITDDCTSCHVAGSPSLANQLATAGLTWGDYQEGMPSACFTGPDATAGRYAKKHNPFVYFDSVVSNPSLCSHVVPATALAGDIAAGRLPAFTWITPNLCNDTHDCSVKTGDTYLAGLVPGLIQALGPHGALFIVWDEGEGSGTAGCCAGLAAGGHV